MLIRKILRFGVLEPLQKTKQEGQGQHHPQQKVASDTRDMLLPIRNHTVQCCRVLVPYQSVGVTTVWSWPIFCCHFSLFLMNTKTLKILPLGCGRNKVKAQPQL